MKPILFSTPMVQAILEGRKTQTRRTIPEKIVDEYYDYDEYCNCVMPAMPYDPEFSCIRHYEKDFFLERARYQTGDILWVRETWMPETEQGIPTGGNIYKATNNPIPDGDCPLRWHPSIHMPKEAARLYLRVTDARVERVQDITFDDIIAEGIVLLPEAYNDPENAYLQARQQYAELWNSLNAKRGFGWEANPWVWVYEFERVEKPEK